jgi:hypothetical protein
MHALKTMLVISLGLGSVWAAWQIAPGETSGMLTNVAYAQQAGPQPAEQTQAAQPAPSKETEEQLARINAALAGDGELKEFKPSEPLPADQAIEMSSEL